MLITIDIFLGLTVIMLLSSMIVTVLAQFATSALNSRGRHLLHGLADLLQQIDPHIERAAATKIAETVLMHPLIRDSMGRYGTTVHREEFTKLLMDMACGNIPKDVSDRLGTKAHSVLISLLEKNGIARPADVLEKVRLQALDLEMTNPGLPFNIRQSRALMKGASSQFLAKINTWFDQIIDRVSGRFTLTTRIITLICSIVVACAIQLDTLALINRLSVDSELRNALVQQAVDKEKSNENAAVTLNKLSGQDTADIKQLLQLGIIHVPKNYREWADNWKNVNYFGIVFTIFLLSLGAPFWYDALKNLLKLRSALAVKDDEQRYERQSRQPNEESEEKESN
ncbi:MAG: hypothetical protein ACU83O_11060 [Gammaproteobacteria bacterium]